MRKYNFQNKDRKIWKSFVPRSETTKTTALEMNHMNHMFEPFVGFNHDLAILANDTRYHRGILSTWRFPRRRHGPVDDYGLIQVTSNFDFQEMGAKPTCIIPPFYQHLFNGEYQGNIVVGAWKRRSVLVRIVCCNLIQLIINCFSFS